MSAGTAARTAGFGRAVAARSCRAVAAAALLACALAPRAETDVPFVTTPDNVTLAMLRLADVRPGDHVIDLGSGDGRIVILAASRFGASGLGVEIVPDLVRRSVENARRAGVAGRARFVEQDLFETDLAPATVVTLYLMPEVNLQLRPRLLALRPGTRVVSHDWDMGDWAPDRSITVNAPDKPVGRDKRSRLHLWIVPAHVDGLWCGAGAGLRIVQRHQHFGAELLGRGTAPRAFEGRVRGHELGGADTPALRLEGAQLRVTRTPAAWSGWHGTRFTRADGERCE